MGIVNPKDKADVIVDLEPVLFRLYQKFHFWADIQERCRFVSTREIPTAGITDGATIYINPDFWRDKTVAQQTFLIAHEVGHKVFRHHDRQQWRIAEIWNLACDYAINWMLVEEMGRDCMIQGGLLDDQYKEMTAEEVYAILLDQAKKGRIKVSCNLEGESEGQDAFDQPGFGQDEKKPQGNQGGIGQDLISGKSEPKDGKTIRDPRDRVPQTEQEWDVAISKAFARAQMMGTVPAGLKRALTDRLEAQVDWVTKLQIYLRTNLPCYGQKDYQMFPPSRRFVGQGMYLPSLVGYQPRVAFAVDTSGSRDNDNLIRALSEIDDARKHYTAQVMLLDCDTEIYCSEWIGPEEPLPELKGGGGTDFRPVFDRVEDEDIDVLVFFTDTWGTFPEQQPRNYDVLWVVDVAGGNVPWGEVIRVNA